MNVHYDSCDFSLELVKVVHIIHQCQNLNCKVAKDGDARPQKKAKLETYAAHAFSPTNADDEVFP